MLRLRALVSALLIAVAQPAAAQQLATARPVLRSWPLEVAALSLQALPSVPDSVRRTYAREGTLVGAVLGAVGGAIGLRRVCLGSASTASDCDIVTVVGAGLGSIFGGLIGRNIGEFIPRSPSHGRKAGGS